MWIRIFLNSYLGLFKGNFGFFYAYSTVFGVLLPNTEYIFFKIFIKLYIFFFFFNIKRIQNVIKGEIRGEGVS